MKTVTTSAKDLYAPGSRLDANFHASEGVKALHFIHRWANYARPWSVQPKEEQEDISTHSTRYLDTLVGVCVSGGIFIPSRFKRIFVNNPEHGMPYLTGGSILQADPMAGAKVLSDRYMSNINGLALRERMILVTCSGTIGHTAYVNANFNGAIGSPDLLRIVANPDRILPGYLFTFLSSNLGKALIEQKTYGAVVQHIEAHHVVDLPVPRLNSSVEQRIHELIEQASALRVDANGELRSIQREIVIALGLRTAFSAPYDHSRAFGTSLLTSRALRLDAYYYIGYAGQAADVVQKLAVPQRKLSEIATEIFNPDIFKRIYVGSDGMPYFMGAEVYELHPKVSRYISRNTPDLERYVLREKMIIIQDAGQRYGLLGTPIYANRTLDGKAATNNMIRIVSPDKTTAGYIFAFLDTDIGRRLVVRELYGSSLPHISPSWLGPIPIPWPEESVRNTLGTRVVIAFDKRAQANALEDEAQALLADALGLET